MVIFHTYELWDSLPEGTCGWFDYVKMIITHLPASEVDEITILLLPQFSCLVANAPATLI